MSRSSGIPKGPFRTKNSTASKFTAAREKCYGKSKTLRRVLRSACFSRKKRQENGTESKKLRTTDSGAVLFLVRKGPLGIVSMSLQQIQRDPRSLSDLDSSLV